MKSPTTNIQRIVTGNWLEILTVFLLAYLAYPYIGPIGLAWLTGTAIVVGFLFVYGRGENWRWHLLPANFSFFILGVSDLALAGDPLLKGSIIYSPLNDTNFLKFLLLCALIVCSYVGLCWDQKLKITGIIFFFSILGVLVVTWRLTSAVEGRFLVYGLRYTPGNYSETVERYLLAPFILFWLVPSCLTLSIHIIASGVGHVVRLIGEGISPTDIPVAISRIILLRLNRQNVDQTTWPRRCQGETRSGEQCRKLARIGSQYCSLHTAQKDRPRTDLRNLITENIRSLAAVCTILSSMLLVSNWIRLTFFAVPITPPDESAILVAQFESMGSESRDIRGRISLALANELASHGGSNVRVYNLPGELHVQNEKDANDLAQRYGATLVIWGSYDASGFWGHVTPNSGLQGKITDSQTALFRNFPTTLEFNQYVSDTLPNRTSYFVDFALGQLYMRDGQNQFAKIFFDRAIELEANDQDRTGLNLDLLYMYRGTVSWSPPVKEEEVNSSGVKTWSSLSIFIPSEAITYYTRAISLTTELSNNHEIPAATDRLAQAYSLRAKAKSYLISKEPLGDYAKAIEFNPSWVATYRDRADLYIKLSRNALALRQLFQRVEITIHNESTGATTKLELSEDERKRIAEQTYPVYWNEALSDLNKAVELAQNDPQSYLDRSALLYELGKYKEAIADCNSALFLLNSGKSGVAWRSEMEERYGMLGGQYGEAYFRRGESYLYEQNLDQALSDFDQAIQNDPLTSAPYFFRAAIYYQNGYRDQARTDLKEFLKRSPRLRSYDANNDISEEFLREMRKDLGIDSP